MAKLPTWARAWLSLWVFLGVFALAAEARAGAPYGVVTIDLQPERGEVPTDVCIVSEVEGPRTRTKVHGGMLGAASGGSARAPSYPLAASFWTHGGSELRACGEGEACAPSVSLPPARAAVPLWAACTTDELLDEGAAGVERRLLVITLEHLEGSPPVIEALRLTGGIVTIGVRARIDDVVVTARSAGGHFAPSPRSERASSTGPDQKLIVLPVEPRCDRIELEVAGVDLSKVEPGAVGLRVHGVDIDAGVCAASIPGTRRMSVLVPRALGRGELDLRLPQSGAGADSRRFFEAEWAGAWPVGVLRLDARQIDFSWRPPACVYPVDACPDAVVEGGIACSVHGDADGCHYRCPGDDEAAADPNASVAAPLTVTFRDTRLDQRWTQILQRRGQILEGFVEADRIYLEADTRDWVLNVPGSRVTHLEVLGNDGSVRRYALSGQERLRIRAPEAGCDPLRYRFVGDRHYQERTAEVIGGEVQIEPPRKSVRPLDFVLTILQGGGPARPFGAPLEVSNPIYFIAQAQIAASYRPRKPKLSRLSFELRLGGHIGQWGYFDEQSYEADPIQVRERVLWARFLFEPAIYVDIWGPFGMGAGLGMGSSWPIRSKETDNTNRFRFILAPSVEGRVRVRSWLYLVGQVRFVLRERTFMAIDDGGGRFRREEYPTLSTLGLYGLGFRF